VDSRTDVGRLTDTRTRERADSCIKFLHITQKRKRGEEERRERFKELLQNQSFGPLGKPRADDGNCSSSTGEGKVQDECA